MHRLSPNWSTLDRLLERLHGGIYFSTQSGDSVFRMCTLPLTTLNNSLETLSAKLSSYVYVLRLDRSLAAATGYRTLPDSIPSPEFRAKNAMPPEERELFEAWRAGQVWPFPAIDWDIHNFWPTNRSAVATFEGYVLSNFPLFAALARASLLAVSSIMSSCLRFHHQINQSVLLDFQSGLMIKTKT